MMTLLWVMLVAFIWLNMAFMFVLFPIMVWGAFIRFKEEWNASKVRR